MGYIIVWRHSLKEPHVDTTDHDFMEVYSSYEAADESAKAALDPSSKWYCEYGIYEEATS
jgi:hypothetical protein